jgi:hypothetical protein
VDVVASHLLPSPNTLIYSTVLLKYYCTAKRDGSATRMTNAGRLRSGRGLPMSDRLVVIGPVGQRAPATSTHPSLAHPGQWIRRHRRRFTQQGATFHNLNSVPETASAPFHKHIVYYTRYYGPPPSTIAYKNLPSTGTAHHIAPFRAPGTSHPTLTRNKSRSHQTLLCAANTRQPLRPHPLLTPTKFHPPQALFTTRRPLCL